MSFDTFNFYGLAFGAIVFIIIGIFHPLVIKGEYYYGKQIWLAFLIFGVIFSSSSIFVANNYIAILLGVVGFSCLWSIKEVFEQVERVKDGRFPKNPKWNYDD